MRHLICFAALAGLFVGLAGCGPALGKVKGKVVENGQPVEIDGQAALMFTLLNADGNPDTSKSYSIPLEKDGSFELVVSGGAVPPGKYLVSFTVNAPKSDKGLGRFRDRFPYPDSKLRQEVKAGANDVTIDLAKPGS